MIWSQTTERGPFVLMSDARMRKVLMPGTRFGHETMTEPFFSVPTSALQTSAQFVPLRISTLTHMVRLDRLHVGSSVTARSFLAASGVRRR